MAVSDSAKVDLLYKKLFGVAKTDLPGNKSPSNEAIASPSLSRIDKLWTQALSIPATAAATTGIVQAYTGASAVQCTADATTTPVSSVYPSWKTNLTDWIPSEFGSTYFVQVWVDSSGVANPTSTGTQIFDSGIAGVGEWNFDYQSGVLNFIGGTIPAALTASKVIYVVGYRYIGYKATNFSNISVGNINISGNTISSTSGNVYISGNLTINGPAVSIGTSDLAVQDPILNLHTYANLAPLTYNDGYDIGLKMHYYDTVDSSAFLGRVNGSGFLEWYNRGSDIANVFVGTSYGTVKTGELLLANTTQATGANTGGALRVWGDAAIAGNVFVGNILTDGFKYANGAPFTSYTNADVAAYLPTYTGNVGAGNITLQNTLYANTIAAVAGNVVTISSTGALTVPVGSTAQRPAGANGQIRYNTDDGSLEYYTAIGGWLPVRNVVIDQAITGDGTTTQFTLSQPATATGLLVSVNGVLQNPNIGAYTVAGDQITFSEAPLVTDSIDVRFIASLTSMPGTISNDLSVLGNLTVTGNITSITGIYTYGNTQVGQYLNHLPGNIVPSANVTYSLGTSTNQWRDLWVSNNTIYIGNTPITVSDGTLLINNTPITGGSTYSNVNVAAYLTTATVTTTGNITTTANVIAPNFLFANGVNILSTVAASSTYSNTNVSAYLTSQNITSANIGGYQTWANANVSGLYNSITGANTTIQTLNANVGAYQTYANANIGTLYNGNISTQANLGAYQVYANTAISAIQANLGVTQIWANANVATINANLGSYQVWANANVSGLYNSILGANAAIVSANTAMKSYVDAGNTTMTSYVGNQVTTANTALKGYTDNQITTANTAVVNYVNTRTNSLATGANTNTAAYLAAGISTNFTTTGNITAGNVLINGALTSYGYVNGSYLFAYNNADQASVGQNGAVNFQVTSSSNGSLITKTSNSQITLAGGNTYALKAVIGRLASSSTWAQFRWYDVTNGAYVGAEGFSEAVTSTATGVGSTLVPTAYVTPNVNTTYELRQTTANTVTVNAYASMEVTQVNPAIAVQATATGTVSKNYAKYVRTTAQSVSAGTVVVCSTLESSSGTAVSVNTSTGQVTLTAGTYRLRGTIGSFSGYAAAALIGYSWYNETTSAYIGEGAGFNGPTSTAWNASGGGTAEAVITVASTTVVSFRVVSVTNTSSIGGTSADFGAPYAYPWIDIEQIGATFALNTLDTMTLTGALTASGDVSGAYLKSTYASGDEGGEIQLTKPPNSTLSGGITIDAYANRIRIFEQGGSARGAYIDLTQASAGVDTLLNNRVSAFVNAGAFVTMDNIKATVTTGGQRGLSLATVSGTATCYIGGTYGGSSVGSGGSSAGLSMTTTASSSIFGWSFPTEGDTATYILNYGYTKSYRITLQIGGSYNNNMITIERLI